MFPMERLPKKKNKDCFSTKSFCPHGSGILANVSELGNLHITKIGNAFKFRIPSVCSTSINVKQILLCLANDHFYWVCYLFTKKLHIKFKYLEQIYFTNLCIEGILCQLISKPVTKNWIVVARISGLALYVRKWVKIL